MRPISVGPENGATVARVVAKLAPNNSRLFLTTTHYHTEHVTGEPGFPPGTVLIRNAVQQQELEKDGHALTDLFRGMSAQNKELLAGVVLRSPDVLFDSEALIDLGGGVKARLLWCLHICEERLLGPRRSPLAHVDEPSSYKLASVAIRRPLTWREQDDPLRELSQLAMCLWRFFTYRGASFTGRAFLGSIHKLP